MRKNGKNPLSSAGVFVRVRAFSRSEIQAFSHADVAAWLNKKFYGIA